MGMKQPMDGAFNGVPPQEDNMGDNAPMANDGEMPNDGGMPDEAPNDMPTEEPDMSGGNEWDDSTAAIIQKLSPEDREAVRAYAESMLSKSEDNATEDNGEDMPEDDGLMDDDHLMEGTFTKAQLNFLTENFGPTQDELTQDLENKPLAGREKKSIKPNSPFVAPDFK